MDARVETLPGQVQQSLGFSCALSGSIRIFSQPLGTMTRIVDVPASTGNGPAALHRFQAKSIRRIQRNYRVLVLTLSLSLIFALVHFCATPPIKAATPDVLRVRELVITDENGIERVIIGAPLHRTVGKRKSEY